MTAGTPGNPARYYSSTAVETSLQSSIPAQAQGASNSSFIVASVSGFPTSYPYTLIIDPDTSKEEVLTVTAGSSTTLVVTRGVDGTQAVAHSAGAVVRHGVSGRDFRESENHIAARGYDIDQAILDAANQTHVHGIATGDGVIVGTTKTQTLTNKTLTSPTITNPNISGAGVDASIVFEGATADAYETTLTVVDPTQDNTITLPNTTGTVVIADAVQTLSNKTLGNALNAGGYKITNLATPTLASDAVRKDFADAQVAAAATSAASAATSASSAATSATSAAASATTAAASVATIAGYATSAANSASAAATSATSAATSASSAASSATAAATSATSAATSATAAATSATSAAASATSAANSASAAATSATSSATSASAAATSASSAATSAASALTSANSAAASFDSFDDRYLGPKASVPTVDNDGNPLTSGVLYYNTTSGVMFVYNGNTSAWEQVAVSTSGFPTLAGNNDFTGLNTFTNAGTADVLRVTNTGTGNSFVVEDSTNPDATPFVIDANGSVIRGNTSWIDVGNNASGFESHVNSGTEYGGLNLINWRNNTAMSAALHFGKAMSNVIGTQAAVSTNNDLGRIGFYGSDGTNFIASSLILAEADGTVSTGIVPGRLVISTADSAGTLTERMRITSGGSIGIGATPTTATAFILGRNATGATTGYGMYVNQTIKSDVTSTYYGLRIVPTTEATTFNLTSLTHIAVGTTTIGAGSTVGSQFGYLVQSTLTGATNNYGFYGSLAVASGVWNAYMNGTAANYFAGQTTVGSTSLTLGSGSVAQQFGVVSTAASNVGAVIRGAASQTGNLQEWQNSGGTILARVNSAGQFVGDGSQLTGISSQATLEEVEQQVIMGALL